MVGRAGEVEELRGAHEDVDGDLFLLDGVRQVPVYLAGVEGAVLGAGRLVDVHQEVVVDQTLLDGSDADSDLVEGLLEVRELVVVVENQGPSDEACVVVEVVNSADETQECQVFLVLRSFQSLGSRYGEKLVLGVVWASTGMLLVELEGEGDCQKEQPGHS